jgi:HK97 family phage portal protein
MGLTTRLMEQRSQVTTLKDPAKWLVDWFGGGTSSSGVTVTATSARRIAAVACAVKIIAESVASLPVFIFKRREDGKGKDRQPKNPLHRLLHDQPNPWQSSFEWLEMMQGHACLRGNAFSEIVYDGRGGVRMLIPRHPDRMRVYDIANAGIGDQVLAYEYQPATGPSRLLLADEVLHLKGLSDDGLVGLSPIDEFREALGLAIGTDLYAGKFFANYGNPGGVLTHPKTLAGDAAKRLREQWEAKHTGIENAHRVAVLEEGLTWTAIGVRPQDSQLLESRKFSVTEIARMFRVPPHMLADLDRATFSNIEQQSIEFVIHTLRPWLVRWEKRLALSLLTANERASGLFIEFNVDGLLRGDIASRYRSYAVGRQWGWLSPNDVRALENMNPREDTGGDAYHEPLNMHSSQREPEDDLLKDDEDKKEKVIA